MRISRRLVGYSQMVVEGGGGGGRAREILLLKDSTVTHNMLWLLSVFYVDFYFLSFMVQYV